MMKSLVSLLLLSTTLECNALANINAQRSDNINSSNHVTSSSRRNLDSKSGKSEKSGKGVYHPDLHHHGYHPHHNGGKADKVSGYGKSGKGEYSKSAKGAYIMDDDHSHDDGYHWSGDDDDHHTHDDDDHTHISEDGQYDDDILNIIVGDDGHDDGHWWGGTNDDNMTHMDDDDMHYYGKSAKDHKSSKSHGSKGHKSAKAKSDKAHKSGKGHHHGHQWHAHHPDEHGHQWYAHHPDASHDHDDGWWSDHTHMPSPAPTPCGKAGKDCPEEIETPAPTINCGKAGKDCPPKPAPKPQTLPPVCLTIPCSINGVPVSPTDFMTEQHSTEPPVPSPIGSISMLTTDPPVNSVTTSATEYVTTERTGGDELPTELVPVTVAPSTPTETKYPTFVPSYSPTTSIQYLTSESSSWFQTGKAYEVDAYTRARMGDTQEAAFAFATSSEEDNSSSSVDNSRRLLSGLISCVGVLIGLWQIV